MQIELEEQGDTGVCGWFLSGDVRRSPSWMKSAINLSSQYQN